MSHHHRFEKDRDLGKDYQHQYGELLSFYSQKNKGRRTRWRTATTDSIWFVLVIIVALTIDFAKGQDVSGHNSCPCLSFEEAIELGAIPMSDTSSFIGEDTDITTYGIGCLPHDQDALICSGANDCSTIVPLPPDCDKSYCKRSWCYVDQKCALSSTPSTLFPGRQYSYATCGEMDRYTYTDRLRSLDGKTFQVGYASNSGGWKGSYNPAGTFAINGQWHGPTFEFIKEAALVGKFTINMTAPPEWLRPQSQEFFGNSNFDFCVYATSLGYLDFCVGGFTISEKRSSVTTMFETTADPVYLVVHNQEGATNLGAFVAATVTVFQPFEGRSWAIIFLVVLPTLGLLMFFHEYGSPGSAFPKVEPILVVKNRAGSAEVVKKPMSLTKHIGSACYTGVLSFFTGSCDISVVTIGGKINLLAMSSFVMIILAVYTANLAAILTENVHATEIDSLDVAIKAGYNFCAERKLADVMMETYGVDPRRIVPDPISLGGDGKPGFNCPDCNSRERVMEFMRRTHDDDSLYCNAAIMKVEDLQKMHSYGNHCDKLTVGDSLGHRTIGIPIYDKHAAPLSALFHKIKSDGAMARSLLADAPRNRCPITEGEGNALSPEQLTGVWVITFGFALIGVLVRCFQMYKGRHYEDIKSEHKIRRCDQWLNPPGYDVVVNGYRYDGENNTIIHQGESAIYSSRASEDGSDNPDDATQEDSCLSTTAGDEYTMRIASLVLGKGTWDEQEKSVNV